MTIIILNIIYWILLIGAVLLIPFSLPGPIIIVVINLGYQLLDKAPGLDWKLLIILFVIAALSELFEYLITAYSSRRSGGSQRAMFAAVAGSIIGAILGTGFFPLVGSLIGALAGAFAGSYLIEYLDHKDSDRAFKVGIGAFTGVAGGKITKIILAVIMLAIIGLNMV